MPVKLLQALGLLQSGMKSLATSMFNLGATMANALVKPINYALEALGGFNDMSIKTARQIGMPFQQSIAYTKVLTSETEKLALAYGVTSKEIAAIQGSYVDNIGRATLLTENQVEHLVQANKLIGTGTTNNIAKGLADLGGSVPGDKELSGMISYMSKAGLSIQTSSSAFANNLKLANSYTFANGIDGIMKMTSLSQKLRFDLDAAMKATETFQNFESAIEASAKLQNLGGLGAAYAANPLTLMYEGLEDPESMIERFTKIWQSMAVFDKKTGMGKISGQNMQIIKEQAKAIGMSEQEAVKIAKNSSRAEAIQGQMGSTYDSLTSDQQDFVTNKATYNTETQQFELGVLNEVTGKIDNIPISKLNPQDIQEIQEKAALTTTDAVKIATKQLTTLGERQTAFFELIRALLADILMPILPEVFKLQAQFFAFMGEVGKFAFKTLFTPDWWKVIGIDIAAMLLKMYVAWSTVDSPLVLACQTVIEILLEIYNGIASVFTALPKIDRTFGLLTTTVENDAIDGLERMVLKGSGLYDTYLDAKSSAMVLAHKAQPMFDTIGTMFNNVTKNFQGRLSSALTTYDNAAVKSIDKQGDVTGNGNKATGVVNNNTVRTTNNTPQYTHEVTFADLGASTNSYSNSVQRIAYNNAINSGNGTQLTNATYLPAEPTVYHAVARNDGSVSYVNTSNIYGESVSKEQTGSIVKGGEVTNGITPVSTTNYQTSVNNNARMEFEPLKVDVSGTIQLATRDGQTANIDTYSLLNNSFFIRELANKVDDALTSQKIGGNVGFAGIKKNAGVVDRAIEGLYNL